MTDEQVLVVGGGIGGLAVALALQKQRVPVSVYEQAPELGEVGAGIQLWVNGMRAVHAIGVADAIRAVSGQMEMMKFRSWRGGTLWEARVGELARRVNAPFPVMIKRPELLRCLSEPLAKGLVNLNKTCSGFAQDPEGVTVRFADGSEARGAVLVAADGIRSVCRTSQFGPVRPQYAGYQYLRGLVPYDRRNFARNTFTFTFGPGDRFASGDVGGGWIYWFAAIVTPQGASDGPEGRKGELLRRYARFADPVLDIIESTPDTAILRHDICDIKPLRAWTAGRMTLMGDAAHAPTPNLGRGASEAIEDGWVLGDCLARVSSLQDGVQVAAALQAFETKRRLKTARMQKLAHRIGAMANWGNPVAWRFREIAMRSVIGRQVNRDNEKEFAEYSLPAPVAV